MYISTEKSLEVDCYNLLTVLSSFLRQSCLVFTNVTMQRIRGFTYLLTYLALATGRYRSQLKPNTHVGAFLLVVYSNS